MPDVPIRVWSQATRKESDVGVWFFSEEKDLRLAMHIEDDNRKPLHVQATAFTFVPKYLSVCVSVFTDSLATANIEIERFIEVARFMRDDLACRMCPACGAPRQGPHAPLCPMAPQSV